MYKTVRRKRGKQRTHATECQNNCENEGNDAYRLENEFERAGTIWNGLFN